MKKLLWIIVIILLGAGIYFLGASQGTAPKDAPDASSTPKAAAPAPAPAAPFDPKNATYHDIDDMTVTLVNGTADSEAAPGSASVITTEYFGNRATGDLNGDGKADTAFIITQYGAGTGIFYYAVAALRTSDGYKTTNAVFIGDRIAPQTTEIRNAEVLVNYADRKPGEAMTEDPTVAATMHLKIIAGGTLVESAK